MMIKVSTKGEVVLPELLRRKLGICAGDVLVTKIEAGRIVLIPQCKKSHKAKIVRDPITGLPVLNAGNSAPVLSSKEVREILREQLLLMNRRIKQ